MLKYSIMPLDAAHIDEVCEDIRQQKENGVADFPLFMFKLVPEGIPAVDKVALYADTYVKFRDKLEKYGVNCGILVQSSLGHGYHIDQMPFQPYVGLAHGKHIYSYCPSDEDLRNYFKKQFAALARLKPAIVMVDDDFRTLFKDGGGCCCPRHLKAFNAAAGTDFTREQLNEILRGEYPETEKYTQIYTEMQRHLLLGCAQAMREGLDEVDPSIQGAYCCCGFHTCFGTDIGRVLAGKNNPSIVRINNGFYTSAGSRWFSGNVSMRTAVQISVLKSTGKPDIILSESDTCPNNRYSTSATTLNAHIIGSVLEGVDGSKLWLTRLASYEPKSGKAYRKKLAENSKRYDALCNLVKNIRWAGARIPMPDKPDFSLRFGDWGKTPYNAWTDCVFERLGFPVYFSSDDGGAVFLEGDNDALLSDEQLLNALKGALFLASDSAQNLIKRGFGKYLGVRLQPWQGDAPSLEKIDCNGEFCEVQQKIMQIIPENDSLQILSMVYHVTEKVKEPLFPGVVSYKNELGGTVTVFAGTPNTKYHYLTAFSFLNESRKLQLARLLTESGNLPVYYTEDAEVYIKAGYLEDGGLLIVVFNLGLDVLEDIPLWFENTPTAIEILETDGKFKKCGFSAEKQVIRVKANCTTLEPIILKASLGD